MGCAGSKTAPLEQAPQSASRPKAGELQRLREEIARLRLARRGTRQEAPRIKYYFVRADKLRETTATTLPALQTMLADAKMRDWIVEKEMSFDDACRGKYVDEYLACSHRWLTDGTANPRRAPPDPKGVQLAAISHLARHCAHEPRQLLRAQVYALLTAPRLDALLNLTSPAALRVLVQARRHRLRCRSAVGELLFQPHEVLLRQPQVRLLRL